MTEPDTSAMTEQEQMDYIRSKLSDKWWRMRTTPKPWPMAPPPFCSSNPASPGPTLNWLSSTELTSMRLRGKPFEIGVMFGTIPERMVRALGEKDTGAQFGKAVARAIGDTFALNPTPQIVKPVVEAVFNYDSFRGGPIDSPQDLAVRAEARYNEQTSLLMRELGELSGLSPKQLEHLLIGYTGTMGSYVMAAADGLIRAARPGESASWRADEIPLMKAVYRGTGPAKSTQHMEEFYRMLNEVNQLKRTVDQYRSEGLTDKANELLEEQGGILKLRRNLSRTQQQIRVVRNRIELIQRDKIMGAEEKRRRIDELLTRRNDLVFQAVNTNRRDWE